MMRSVRQPINVAMLGLIFFAAIFVSRPLAVVGILFYVIMLISMSRHLAEFDIED